MIFFVVVFLSSNIDGFVGHGHVFGWCFRSLLLLRVPHEHDECKYIDDEHQPCNVNTITVAVESEREREENNTRFVIPVNVPYLQLQPAHLYFDPFGKVYDRFSCSYSTAWNNTCSTTKHVQAIKQNNIN